MIYIFALLRYALAYRYRYRYPYPYQVSRVLSSAINTSTLRSANLDTTGLIEEANLDYSRTMNKIIIAQIEGRVGGGGSELSAAFDMRFGVQGKTRVNQMEVPLGIIPGGTGTQRLPRLMGRGRALEVILSGDDMDAETAERWGYLNRIFEPDEIGPFVDRLAHRIASFPPAAVQLAKQSVNQADKPWLDGLFEEAYLFK